MFFWEVERGNADTRVDNEELHLLFDWFSKMAREGDAEAQRKVGCAYAKGFGVAQDSREALNWLIKSADQGNAKAQVAVGKMYMDGDGVAKNMETAIKWFSKAAEHEDSETSTARAYINFLKQYGLPESTLVKDRKSDSNRPTSIAEGVEVVEFSTKIMERETEYVTWSWKLGLKNEMADSKRIMAKIQFVDTEGFELDETWAQADIAGARADTFTGSVRIKADISSRISKARLVFP
jgi:TPR repeat protein